MATRKKAKTHTKRRTTHRRRISGVNTDNHTLQLVAGLAAGAIATDMIGKALGANTNPKFVAAGMIGVGLVISKGGGHNPFMEGLGLGIMSQGTVGAMKQFGLIKGTDVTYALPMAGIEDSMNGYLQQPISAVPEEYMGYSGDDGIYGTDEGEDNSQQVNYRSSSDIYDTFENEPVGQDY